MVILVFGKSGQVATELAKLPDVVCLGRAEADLTHPANCADAIRSHRPDAVINAAAYTSVDRAEEEEDLATIVNGEAPAAMARACAELGIPLIHISTDYVFDGKSDKPWALNDPTAPQNAYGRSKLVGEIGIRDSGAVHAILRTSWVVSAHRTNFVTTMLALSQARDTLAVVDDQIGGPTPARDIANACLQIAKELILDPSKAGTYHYSGMPDVSWADFARAIFDLAGKDVRVTSIPTTEYPTPAKRPMNSRMDCSAIGRAFDITRPEWLNGLLDILRELEDTI